MKILASLAIYSNIHGHQEGNFGSPLSSMTRAVDSFPAHRVSLGTDSARVGRERALKLRNLSSGIEFSYSLPKISISIDSKITRLKKISISFSQDLRLNDEKIFERQSVKNNRSWPVCKIANSMTMMTSSNGNIFRVTGHLCGEFTGHRWISHTQRPVTRSFDVFCDLRLNNRLSKQWCGWWFYILSRPLWRHSNGCIKEDRCKGRTKDVLTLFSSIDTGSDSTLISNWTLSPSIRYFQRLSTK